MTNPNSIEIKQRKIKNFFDTEVKEFAQYVIRSRAMPSIMDGLRVGARKIMWAVMNGDLSKKNKVKMPSLIGDTLKFHYNHGPVALENTIVQLCSTHILKYCPLEITGQIGDLRAPGSSPAARYLHIKKSKFLDIWKADTELLEIQEDDGEKIEPSYFLPIIPVVLLYRTNSPGFGFSFKSFSYNLDDIIDNCIKSLIHGSCANSDETIPLRPDIIGIKQENIIFNSSKNSWYNVGEYEMDLDNDLLIIRDFPYNVTFENFEEHLLNLQEKEYITSFTNLSQDETICYVIKFQKSRLKALSNDKWKFFNTMKLFSKIPKDTLNCIDCDGKTMLFFETPYDLIDTFIKKRLVFYQKRKDKLQKIFGEKITKMNEKIKFIQLVTEDKLVINKRAVSEIKKDLDSHNLPYDVLKLNIEKLTKEEIEKLKLDKKDAEDYLDYINSTTSENLYLLELIELKQKYSNIEIKQ